MTEPTDWPYFNYANILSEAKARLVEAREHPTKLTPQTDTLEYWCAWAAHANAASVLREKIADELDPAHAPDGDALLLAIHAEIQNTRPDIIVEHRNVVLRAAAVAIRRAFGR